jgi:hypothetical protein
LLTALHHTICRALTSSALGQKRLLIKAKKKNDLRFRLVVAKESVSVAPTCVYEQENPPLGQRPIFEQ